MGRPEHACSQATAPPDCPGSLLYGGEAVARSAVAEAVDGSASGIRAVRSRLGNAVSEPPPDAAGDTDPVCASAVGWALRVLQAEQAPLAEMERVLKEAMSG